MLLSSTLIGAALFAIQSDPTRAPREAYSSCLFQQVEKAVKDKTSASDFNSQLAAACQQQERAFRAALQSARYSADDINLEVEDTRTNMKQRYEDGTTPR